MGSIPYRGEGIAYSLPTGQDFQEYYFLGKSARQQFELNNICHCEGDTPPSRHSPCSKNNSSPPRGHFVREHLAHSRLAMTMIQAYKKNLKSARLCRYKEKNRRRLTPVFQQGGMRDTCMICQVNHVPVQVSVPPYILTRPQSSVPIIHPPADAVSPAWWCHLCGPYGWSRRDRQ